MDHPARSVSLRRRLSVFLSRTNTHIVLSHSHMQQFLPLLNLILLYGCDLCDVLRCYCKSTDDGCVDILSHCSRWSDLVVYFLCLFTETLMDTKWATTELAWTAHPETGVSLLGSVWLWSEDTARFTSLCYVTGDWRVLSVSPVLCTLGSKSLDRICFNIQQDAPFRDEKKMLCNPISLTRPVTDGPFPLPLCTQNTLKVSVSSWRNPLTTEIFPGADPLHIQASKSNTHKSASDSLVVLSHVPFTMGQRRAERVVTPSSATLQRPPALLPSPLCGPMT